MPKARQYRQAAAASVPGVDHGPPFSLRSRESSRPRLLCCWTLDLFELDLYIGIEFTNTEKSTNGFEIVY